LGGRIQVMTTTPGATTDYYRLLGVSPDATHEELRAAYRGKVRLCHPDLVADEGEEVRQAATEMTTLLNEAYLCLSDPDRRASYDTGNRVDTTSVGRPSTGHRDADFTPPHRPDPTSSLRGLWTRRPERRVRDLTTISLGGIVLPLLVLAWTLSQFPAPTPANPALVASACAGVVAATTWVLTSSRLMRQPDRLARIGVTWAHLMRWSGWILVGSCAVVLGIPAVAGLLTVIAVIASPILGLVLIALISARFDSKDG
jgi:hypothetical protein